MSRLCRMLLMVTTIVATVSSAALARASGMPPTAVDRRAVVSRHDPRLKAKRGTEGHLAPSFLTLGNGDFAFTTDFTGLQSFNSTDVAPRPKCNGVQESGPGSSSCGDLRYAVCPRYTMSNWGWHAVPASVAPRKAGGTGIDPSAYKFAEFSAYGRRSAYAWAGSSLHAPGMQLDCGAACADATDFLRGNPHKFSLGRLFFLDGNGTELRPAGCTSISQHLELWTSILTSNFTWLGERVRVTTVASMDADIVAVRVESKLLVTGNLKLGLSFPFAADYTKHKNGLAADYEQPHRHTTTATINGSCASFHRQLDKQSYDAAVAVHELDATIAAMEVPHGFVLAPSLRSSVAHVVLGFSNGSVAALAPTNLPTFDDVLRNTKMRWGAFWESGAAVDLSPAFPLDARTKALEAKIVLSQHTLRVQEAGRLPPAETGLTLNSWWGDWHGEMRPWHQLFNAAWGRLPLLQRSDAAYDSILPEAIAYATLQGFEGARWPKQRHINTTAGRPDVIMAPSGQGPLLVQEQVHPIGYSETAFRQAGIAAEREKVLARFWPWVNESSRFMVSFLMRSKGHPSPPGQPACLNLGPPVIAGMVNTENPQNVTACKDSGHFPNCWMGERNPTYELTSWKWALRVAQSWRQRLNLTNDSALDYVEHHICQPVLHKVRDPLLAGGKPQAVYYNMETDVAITDGHGDATNAQLYSGHAYPGVDFLEAGALRNTMLLLYSGSKWLSPLEQPMACDTVLNSITANRLGLHELATEILLANDCALHFNPINGHNQQVNRSTPCANSYTVGMNLPLFTPTNGGLLLSVAAMSGGWLGAEGSKWPKEWKVKTEGFQPLL